MSLDDIYNCVRPHRRPVVFTRDSDFPAVSIQGFGVQEDEFTEIMGYMREPEVAADAKSMREWVNSLTREHAARNENSYFPHLDGGDSVCSCKAFENAHKITGFGSNPCKHLVGLERAVGKYCRRKDIAVPEFASIPIMAPPMRRSPRAVAPKLDHHKRRATCNRRFFKVVATVDLSNDSDGDGYNDDGDSIQADLIHGHDAAFHPVEVPIQEQPVLPSASTGFVSLSDSELNKAMDHFAWTS